MNKWPLVYITNLLTKIHYLKHRFLSTPRSDLNHSSVQRPKMSSSKRKISRQDSEDSQKAKGCDASSCPPPLSFLKPQILKVKRRDGSVYVYTRKIGKDWHKDPLLQGWFQPNSDYTAGYCKMCGITVQPRLTALRQHGQKYHRAVVEAQNNQMKEELPPEEEHSPEDDEDDNFSYEVNMEHENVEPIEAAEEPIVGDCQSPSSWADIETEREQLAREREEFEREKREFRKQKQIFYGLLKYFNVEIQD